jgi:lysine-specific demethylase/histidyl-hydroxylase NO66
LTIIDLLEKPVKRIKIVSPNNPQISKIKKAKLASNGDCSGSSSAIKSDHKESNSIEEGKEMFKWIMSGVNIEDFMRDFWEKKPKLIKRNDPIYYSSLMSMETIQNIIKENYLEYTKNVDVTSYTDGTRETHNPVGRVSSNIWSFYEEGCSIRLLNPQTFIPAVYKMSSKLQEYFHCMVGTNAYLTPANSQGFAPHYDDIEAFVLQLEGQKRWRVYEPRDSSEYLVRESSENFQQDEIGEPILDVVVEAGDLLYFPRGFIHQALTVDDKHSLHLTVSVYQKTSYADLLEFLIPAALKEAIKSDVRFREGLPLNLHQICGSVFSENDTAERTSVRNHIKSLFDQVFNFANIDNAVDQMGKKFQADALPPYISKHERQRSMYGEKVEIHEGEVTFPFEISLDTNVRLLKANILRLVEEDDAFRVYFHTDNSKEYHQFEPTFMEIEEDDTIVISTLVNSYPHYICVKDLPIEDDERKTLIISDLWEKGLLMTDKVVE